MPRSTPYDSTDIRGEDLRSRRVAKRVTITEIAISCGVSRQSVWLLERPGHYVTARIAVRYLDAVDRAVSLRAKRTQALLGGAPADRTRRAGGTEGKFSAEPSS